MVFILRKFKLYNSRGDYVVTEKPLRALSHNHRKSIGQLMDRISDVIPNIKKYSINCKTGLKTESFILDRNYDK